MDIKKENTTNQRWEMYYKLPQSVRDALFSDNTSQMIFSIAKSEGLLPHSEKLAEITGDVMLGILPITRFRETLQDKLNIDEEKARRVAKGVRDKIFMPIAQELRKVHNLG